MNKRGLCLVALAWGIGLPVAPALAAELKASGSELVFFPEAQVPAYQLRVAGPDGTVFEDYFMADERMWFAAKDLPSGGADGSYTYEITPIVAMEVRSSVGADVGGAVSAAEATESGAFRIVGGSFVVAGQGGDEPGGGQVISGTTGDPMVSQPLDQVMTDDLIVQSSICVGFDCVSGENFGADTIRLKENNTRIKFEDTSNSGSFPSNDWQLTANDQANGGLNKFSIDDITGNKTPFTIIAGAPSNSLFVSSIGKVGFGTSTPVLDLHLSKGDTPAIRLDQNGSAGWSPQIWDVAGNETNFFVRDVTGGSKLPFRIRAGAAGNSLYIDTDGDVGMGTASPGGRLHVVANDSGFPNGLVLENTNATSTFVGFRMKTSTTTIDFNNTAGEWRLNFDDGDGKELSLDANGNLTISGSLTANGNTFPDYVFAPEYKLMPLSEVAAHIEQHGRLPNVPSADDIARDGLNMTEMQKKLMEKVEELTLYVIDQQKVIEELRTDLAKLKSE